MLAEIWRQLGDPDLASDHAEIRRVLADALLAAGDPQGEYIVIGQDQLSPIEDADPVDLAAWEASLQTHARAWLGAYAQVTMRAQFARGFPWRIELNAHYPDDDVLETIVADPRFGTVEDLVTGVGRAPLYNAIVARGAVASLKRVEIKSLATLEAVMASRARIEHVSIPVWHDRGTLEEALAASVLPACDRLPHVVSIAVPDEQRDLVFGARVFPRLSTITIGPDIGYGMAYWRMMLPHQTLVIGEPRLASCGRPYPGEIRIAREAGGVIARVRGANMETQLAGIIATLPKETTRLEYYGGYLWTGAIKEACDARGIEWVHDVRPDKRPFGYVRI